MRPLKPLAVLSLALSLAGAACSGGGSTVPAAEPEGDAPPRAASRRPEPPSLPRGQVVLEPPGREPVTFEVEVANEDRTRQRGLMFRRQMAENAGMLFLFDETEHLSFWMHNTYLPLDMVFITSAMRVLGVVENAEPQTDDPREVEGDSQYVLELNAGTARRYGIGPGVLVRFVGIPREAEPRGGSRSE
jgi:uncharacterized membrane protein (UPF0127 family)